MDLQNPMKLEEQENAVKSLEQSRQTSSTSPQSSGERKSDDATESRLEVSSSSHDPDSQATSLQILEKRLDYFSDDARQSTINAKGYPTTSSRDLTKEDKTKWEGYRQKWIYNENKTYQEIREMYKKIKCELYFEE